LASLVMFLAIDIALLNVEGNGALHHFTTVIGAF
jgi:hypothetical protein